MNTCPNCGLPMTHYGTHVTLKDCIQELQRRAKNLERQMLDVEAKRRELEAKQDLTQDEWGNRLDPAPPHFNED